MLATTRPATTWIPSSIGGGDEDLQPVGGVRPRHPAPLGRNIRQGQVRQHLGVVLRGLAVGQSAGLLQQPLPLVRVHGRHALGQPCGLLGILALVETPVRLSDQQGAVRPVQEALADEVRPEARRTHPQPQVFQGLAHVQEAQRILIEEPGLGGAHGQIQAEGETVAGDGAPGQLQLVQGRRQFRSAMPSWATCSRRLMIKTSMAGAPSGSMPLSPRPKTPLRPVVW